MHSGRPAAPINTIRLRHGSRLQPPRASLPANAAATNMIAPTDKSTPAVSSTKVIPIAASAVEDD
jgi:hypothetical protein